MKKVHVSKDYYNNGKRYEVIAKTEVTLLLEVKVGKNKTYQVIDYTEVYPKSETDLSKLNPFRTPCIGAAKKEYAQRNQTIIK